MIQLSTKHFITGEEVSTTELSDLIDTAIELKKIRHTSKDFRLSRPCHLAMMFDKPSLRTRFSFSVAMTELGGHVIESVGANRKKEEPKDTIRVLQGYVDAVMIRTDDPQFVFDMAEVSRVPIINGLTDDDHPCQTLADLQTLKERFGTLEGLTLSYVGDGNNILHSLLLLAPCLGVNIHYSCPQGYGPSSLILNRAIRRASGANGRIQSFVRPEDAVAGAHAVYTDVWTSMGFEKSARERAKAFLEFQVNEELMSYTDRSAVFLHCLPMERGQEVSSTLPDLDCSAIFQQSENRLHAQKALLVGLLNRDGVSL